MTGKTAFEIRLELAQGHWEIGEHDEALRCLERALGEAGDDPLDSRLAEVASQLAYGLTQHVGMEAVGGVRERLQQLLDATAPPEAREEPAEPEDELGSSIATPTLAELLASQGHADQALRVADEVLQKSPEDARALAVRESLAGEPTPSSSPAEEAAREAAREVARTVADDAVSWAAADTAFEQPRVSDEPAPAPRASTDDALSRCLEAAESTEAEWRAEGPLPRDVGLEAEAVRSEPIPAGATADTARVPIQGGPVAGNERVIMELQRWLRNLELRKAEGGAPA